MKQFFIIAALFAFSTAAYASPQDTMLTLKGKVTISIKQGTIDCDVILVNIPTIDDYYIRLNTGMNVRYFRNMKDNYNFAYRKDYNDTTSYEAFGYYLPDNTGNAKFLPQGLRFSYTGKFPVIADTLKASNSGDWKGNIAFNGYSLRTDGAQSAWYPVLHDIKNDKSYYEMLYDIDIECDDCNYIYLNGNAPVKGHHAVFKTARPAEGTLFAGNFYVYNVDSTFFINPDISKDQMKVFGSMTELYKKYYEKNLRIPYTEKITYINATPVSKKNAWLFVSYPTIVNVGWDKYGLKGYFDEKEANNFKPFIAHELGHYYFGKSLVFNTEFGEVLGESLTEYLSFKAAEDVMKDTVYASLLQKKLNSLKDFHPVPFSKITREKDLGDRELYLYTYAPVIFVAVEKEIGKDAMWKWLHTILTTPTNFTDYSFLKNTLAATLHDSAKLKEIEGNYFTSDSSLQNAIAIISAK